MSDKINESGNNLTDKVFGIIGGIIFTTIIVLSVIKFIDILDEAENPVLHGNVELVKQKYETAKLMNHIKYKECMKVNSREVCDKGDDGIKIYKQYKIDEEKAYEVRIEKKKNHKPSLLDDLLN